MYGHACKFCNAVFLDKDKHEKHESTCKKSVDTRHVFKAYNRPAGSAMKAVLTWLRDNPNSSAKSMPKSVQALLSDDVYTMLKRLEGMGMVTHVETTGVYKKLWSITDKGKAAC